MFRIFSFRFLFVGFFITALGVVDLDAFHIIGGEITYECLGDGADPNTRRFRFQMFLYRDCLGGGANLDGAASIGIWERDNAGQFIYRGMLSPGLVGPNPVDPPEIECLIPPDDICVEEGSYTWIVSLPIINNSYFFSYQRCCRNSSISNIINPDEIGATYFVELTALAQSECNNSATFANFPPTVICVNEPLSFDHSAIDVDGDSLVYEFTSPKIGGGLAGAGGPGSGDPNGCQGVQPIPGCAPPYTNVTFRSPIYSFDRPMAGDPVVVIDTFTGEITGIPQTLGQYVVGVSVKEYRNGVLINTLNRDFQFNVEDCESTVVAQIQSDETDMDQNYLFTTCGEQTINFVNESFLQEQISSYLWQFDFKEGEIAEFTTRDATVTFPDTGLFEGILYLNRNSICEDSATIAVRILPDLQADFDFSYDTCVVGPVTFDNSSFTNAQFITGYSWDFGGEGISSALNPIFSFPSPGVKQVALTITDNNNCVDQIVQDVAWQPAPQTIIVQPNTFLGCEPADITFINLSNPIDETYTFNWSFGDGSTGNDLSPVHTYAESGVYDVSLEIISPIGCQVEDTFESLIRVEPGPTADFDFSPSELTVFNNTASFTNRSQNEVSWFWDFDRESFSTEENPVYTFRDTGLQEVKLIVTRDNGCQDTISKFIDVIPEVIFHMPNAFTPNNDGNNEEFFGKGILDGMTNFEFSIWNRWGERIFFTTDPNEGWNGRKNNSGEDAPVGSYPYLVTFKGPRGEDYTFKGSANLIR